MLMQRIATSFKSRRKNPSEPEPPRSAPPEDDPNVYSDEDWSDSEFDHVEYELYADPTTAPPSRLNAAPHLPPPMSPTIQRGRTRPLPPTPTTQDDNGEGLYMGPGDAYRGLGRMNHTPPRPPDNQWNGIMPRSNASQPIGLVEEEGLYMGPNDANPHTRGVHQAPPLPPSRQAPKRPDEQGNVETCSSIVSANDDKEDYYEKIDVIEGLRSNRPSPGSAPSGIAASIPNLQEARNALRKPSPAGTKPPTAPRPGAFHGFPVAKPRSPPQTLPKPSHVAGMAGFGRVSGGGVENHGIVGGSDITDPVRARILAGAKILPQLPVNNMPKLKSPEFARRNISPSMARQVDSSKPIPPAPPAQSRKPPWAIQRQIKTLPVTPDPPPQIPPSFPQQRQPQTPSGDVNDLHHYQWYHGTIDRAHVNERLYSVNLNGAYLVRMSSRGGETLPYALSILFNDKVWNLHIRLRHDNSYALGTAKHGEMTFNSIPELVEYHKTTVLILSGSFGGETTLAEAPRRLQQFNT